MTPTLQKGVLRPDGRDIYDNSGVSRADPYGGRSFPWVVPPPGYVIINRRGTIPAPVNGVQTLVTSFTVPAAMNAIILYVLNQFSGTDAGGNVGSGTVNYVIDINRPLGTLGAGIGYSPPDFSTIVTQLGSITQGAPFPIPGGIYLNEQDTIRYKVTTTAPAGVGAPNFITCMLLGWMWPARLPAPSNAGLGR